MPTDTFQAALLGGHKENAAEVPFDPGVRWSLAARSLRPGRRGFPVHASLDGIPFESAIVRRSGQFWLLVPAEVSASAAVDVGMSGLFEVTPHDASGATPSRG